MKMNRETRRTVAQFLNALAVAVLVAGVIGPLSLGVATAPTAVIAMFVGATLHALALFTSVS
ncbi:MAG TPA: hypothetical protein VIL88_12685 [Devosia sp.]|jgi:hypothetical protein|uniref:hypothetical protein n=1 Tax=Devosia sp. TaxID=1871048 RepID=UPI002F920A9D